MDVIASALLFCHCERSEAISTVRKSEIATPAKSVLAMTALDIKLFAHLLYGALLLNTIDIKAIHLQPAKKFPIISSSSRKNSSLSFTCENHILLWFYVILQDNRLWITRQRSRKYEKKLDFQGQIWSNY